MIPFSTPCIRCLDPRNRRLLFQPRNVPSLFFPDAFIDFYAAIRYRVFPVPGSTLVYLPRKNRSYVRVSSNMWFLVPCPPVPDPRFRDGLEFLERATSPADFRVKRSLSLSERVIFLVVQLARVLPLRVFPVFHLEFCFGLGRLTGVFPPMTFFFESPAGSGTECNFPPTNPPNPPPPPTPPPLPRVPLPGAMKLSNGTLLLFLAPF